MGSMINQLQRRLKAFSFPRMAGTEGEKKAQVFLFQELKKMHIKPIVENFEYQTKDFQKFLYLIISVLIFIGNFIMGLVNSKTGTIVFLICFLGFELLQFLNPIWLQVKTSKNPIKRSKNIAFQAFSEKNLEFGAKMGSLILTTYYDSYYLRIHGMWKRLWQIITIIGLGGLIISDFLYVITVNLFNPTNPLLNNSYWVLIWAGIAIVIKIMSFFLNKPLNYTPGTLDNASGCCYLLELIERIKNDALSLQWLDIQILFLGAENFEHEGMKTFLKENAINLRDYAEIDIIAIDSLIAPLIYEKSILKPKNDSWFSELLLHHANRLNLQLKHAFMIHEEPWKSSISLRDNFQYIHIHGNNNSLIHSKSDTFQQFNEKVCKDTG